MIRATYSTHDIRIRAVRAVVEEALAVTVVAQAFGIDRTTLHRWLARYDALGFTGLERLPGSGRSRKLAELDADALRKMVLAPASAFGYETDFWTTRRLIQVIDSEFGVNISKQTVMRRLHEAGLTQLLSRFGTGRSWRRGVGRVASMNCSFAGSRFRADYSDHGWSEITSGTRRHARTATGCARCRVGSAAASTDAAEGRVGNAAASIDAAKVRAGGRLSQIVAA